MTDASTKRSIAGTTLRLVRGDITQQHADAIVNAANNSLMGGGGVDGAIHRHGGPAILDACKAIRREQYPDGLPTGEAVTTTGGDLPARYVIHTVGPVWHGGGRDEERLLARAYSRSLDQALEHDVRTIAFPSISTGAYGYPIEAAASIAVHATADYAARHPDSFEEICFVLFTEHDLEVYREALNALPDAP